jgi:molybdenum ABC transporter molybdate-binding protein
MTVRRTICAALVVVACLAASAAVRAAEPITIGFGMALTGGLAAIGKSALLAMKIWEADVNQKGGLLGRPVKLVYYDDQSNPATIPALYTKLIDVDKVDITVSGYATNMVAPAMPIMIQRDRLFLGLFVVLLAVTVAEYSLSMRQEKVELVVHCAAVMADPLETVREDYEIRNGIRLNIIYDGSGALLGRLHASNTPGDIFIAAERSYLLDAEREGIANDLRAVATITPVLAVKPGNPKHIQQLSDLLRDDVRVSLADPDAAAAGHVARRVLQSQGLWDAFAARIKSGGVSYQGTVSKSASDIVIGAADVAIVWVPTARAAKLDAVHDPVLDAKPEQIMLGLLTRSKHPTDAKEFANFLTGPKAAAVFERLGFGKVNADGR